MDTVREMGGQGEDSKVKGKGPKEERKGFAPRCTGIELPLGLYDSHR